MRPIRLMFAAVLLASVSTSVLADDWVADRLRGNVAILQGGDWVVLARGQMVPDGGQIRTESNGRVDLVRGAERISVAPNTEIAIRDAGGQKMTSVIQSRGTVTIEAERRNVQHFSVQTPVLAAVVKGTQFTVTYSNGQASVSVDRGVVQVQDAGHEMVVDVTPGQTAEARQSQPLNVSGPGSENSVFLIQGEVVPAAAREAVISGAIAASEAVAAVQSGTLEQPRSASGENRNSGANGEPGNSNSSNGRGNSGNGNGNGNSGNGQSNNGNANGHGNGNSDDRNSDNGNSNNGNGNSGNSNGGGNSGNGNGNGGNSGNGNSGHGNGNGNSGQGNGNGGGNSGNGQGNGGNNGNGNGQGNSGNSSVSAEAPASVSSSDNGGSGNNGNGNGGGNGNGNNGNGNGNGGGDGNNGNGGNGNNGNGNGHGNH